MRRKSQKTKKSQRQKEGEQAQGLLEYFVAAVYVCAVSIQAVRCTDSSFILAGQLLSAPYLCLPLVRLVLTPGSLLRCFPLLLHGTYIFTRRSREEKQGEEIMRRWEFEVESVTGEKRGEERLHVSASH